jgi:hypothetical protein
VFFPPEGDAEARSQHDTTEERAFGPPAAYTGKIILFSLIAAVPVVLTKAPLAAFFARLTPARLPRNLFPFLSGALLFAATGILLLAVTRDRNLRTLIHRQPQMTRMSADKHGY